MRHLLSDKDFCEIGSLSKFEQLQVCHVTPLIQVSFQSDVVFYIRRQDFETVSQILKQIRREVN